MSICGKTPTKPASQTHNVFSRGRYDADVIVDTLNTYRKFAVNIFQDDTISLGNIACS